MFLKCVWNRDRILDFICHGAYSQNSHLVLFRLLGRHHQVILDVSGAVLAGAVKVVLLLQNVLAVGRQLEEVHVAHCQLLTLSNLTQRTQLNPG